MLIKIIWKWWRLIQSLRNNKFFIRSLNLRIELELLALGRMVFIQRALYLENGIIHSFVRSSKILIQEKLVWTIFLRYKTDDETILEKINIFINLLNISSYYNQTSVAWRQQKQPVYLSRHFLKVYIFFLF